MFRGFSFGFTIGPDGPNGRIPRGDAEDLFNAVIGDSALQVKILNNQIHALNMTIATLINENRKLQEANVNMESRFKMFEKIIKATDYKLPPNTAVEEDEVCPICMGSLSEKKARHRECPFTHATCLSCFASMCTSANKILCPICRKSIEEEDLVIE